MEPHHQSQQQQANEDSSSGSGKGGSFICRPSSTRWTPTPEQIRILKDLYYNNGVRSPTAEQIQKISARLRQYGKIEGKNVFYWFQNHKARERQKKRLTATIPTSVPDVPMQQQQKLAPNCGWKPEDYLLKPQLNPAPSSSSAGHGVYIPGQMGNFGSYGSVTMEKSFRDCSISSGGSGVGGSITHNFGWVGIDPYTSSSYSLFGNKIEELEEDDDEDEDEDEDDDDDESANIETLPLFPMHGEDNFNTFCNFKRGPNSYCTGKYGSDDGHGGSRTSLELSLNSYTSWSSGPM